KWSPHHNPPKSPPTMAPANAPAKASNTARIVARTHSRSSARTIARIASPNPQRMDLPARSPAPAVFPSYHAKPHPVTPSPRPCGTASRPSILNAEVVTLRPLNPGETLPMRAPIWLPVLFLPILVSVAEASAPPRFTVPLLIEQLGNTRFETREAAAKALRDLGPAVLPDLRKALDHPDVEVRRRLQELIP